ncbi:hypothetical protein SLE2022_287270 [Rubroshorea leprosula]
MEEGTTSSSGLLAPDTDIFSHSGPLHLTHIDWKNFHHRRSIAASLVQGVRVLEFDRQQNRQGQQAHAPEWWEFFHFQLVCPLIDVDNSIFGAIYELKFSGLDNSAQIVPRFVIAFRGTIKMQASLPRDLKLDLLCVCNKLHESSRFQIAMQAVQNMVTLAGASNIWLTGHSLGSAIALLAGKNMVKMHSYIETYLFNPPFLSVPKEIIPNEGLWQGIHLASTVIRVGLARAKGLYRIQRPKQFDQVTNQVTALLSLWVPYLFVNPGDHICSGYIRYFEQRKSMTEKLPEISSESSFSNADSESLHLLPSAYLTINLGYTPDFKRAHGIHQWWDPNFDGRSEHYR